jgi:hypothetical protein
MAIKYSYGNSPNSKVIKSSASAPKARVGNVRKPARLRGFLPASLGQHCPPHYPGPPAPNFAQQGPFPRPPGCAPAPLHVKLGAPLSIAQVAYLIGCSPWTVRQTLLPRGLPHFRFTASGRLIFYRDQVIRWIENQQQGGKTTK